MTTTTPPQAACPPVRTWSPPLASTRELLLGGAIVAIVLLVGLTNPAFLSMGSFASILTDSVSVGLLAVGLAVVVLAGGIDISVGSTLAASAICAGLVAQAGLGVTTAVIAGIVCGAVLGAVNAGLIVGLRIQPIVATLATYGIFRGVLVAATSDVQINALPPGFTRLGEARLLTLPLPVWVLIACTVLLILVMRSTGFGQAIYAIGSNEPAARRAGVPVGGVLVAAYTLSGAVAGLAGVMFLARNGTVLAQSGVGIELLAIAAVVVGGVNIVGGSGHVLGVGLAAFFFATVNAAVVTLGVGAAWLDAAGGVVIVLTIGLLAVSEVARRRDDG